MDVLQKTTFRGGYERVLALKQFDAPDNVRPLFTGPALVLFAEAEENVMVSESPTMAAFRDQGIFGSIFPQGVMRSVISSEGRDPVAHASLIFHHKYYNHQLEFWYRGLQTQALKAVL